MENFRKVLFLFLRGIFDKRKHPGFGKEAQDNRKEVIKAENSTFLS